MSISCRRQVCEAEGLRNASWTGSSVFVEGGPAVSSANKVGAPPSSTQSHSPFSSLPSCRPSGYWGEISPASSPASPTTFRTHPAEPTARRATPLIQSTLAEPTLRNHRPIRRVELGRTIVNLRVAITAPGVDVAFPRCSSPRVGHVACAACFFDVILVVLLGGPEGLGRFHLRDDLPPAVPVAAG